MIYERNIKERWKEASKNSKILFLVGATGVGKTTLLNSLKEEKRKYISLENLSIRLEAIKNPDTFLKKYSPPLLIDEIELVPELFLAIQNYSLSSKKKDLFWLTSSYFLTIKEEIKDEISTFFLSSCTYRELSQSPYLPYNFDGFYEKKEFLKTDLLKQMLNGGMPGFVLDKDRRELYFENYMNSYLNIEIRRFKQIEDINAFLLFMISVAQNVGRILNASKLSSDCGKDVKTVQSWIEVLEKTGIIQLLYPLKKKELKRMNSTPKILFLDSGLCTYLCNIHTTSDLEEYPNITFLFQNYVITEMIKINNNYGLGSTFSFYKDKDGNEIDLIVEEENETFHPFQIFYKNQVDENMISSFKKINKLPKKGIGGIIYISNIIKNIEERNYAVPFSTFLS